MKYNKLGDHKKTGIGLIVLILELSLQLDSE